jgi:hypothetical protein
LNAQVEACIRLAIDRRDQRAADAEDRLEGLRRAYEASTSLEVVRRLLLDDGVEQSLVDEALREAGYRLRLVTAADSRLAGQEPFVVWVHQDKSGSQVEVYRHSDLYAFGEDEDEALSRLGELMELVLREFQERPSGQAQARALNELEMFLTRVLGSGPETPDE